MPCLHATSGYHQTTLRYLYYFKVFRQAGWSTPRRGVGLDAQSDSPLPFEPARAPIISQDGHHRLQRSREELQDDFSSRLYKLATSPTPQAPPAATNQKVSAQSQSGRDHGETAAGVEQTHSVDVCGVAMDIPKSFEEVYRLSQRNRQRNKDKRRGDEGEAGEGGEDSDAMDVGSEEHGRSSEERDEDGPFALRSNLQAAGKESGKHAVGADFYLQGADGAPDTSVEGTVRIGCCFQLPEVASFSNRLPV
jgi:hypothetical protein